MTVELEGDPQVVQALASLPRAQTAPQPGRTRQQMTRMQALPQSVKRSKVAVNSPAGASNPFLMNIDAQDAQD